MDESVECQHCGEKIFVTESRLPVTCAERQDDEQRSFVIVGADNWLLHRCVIGDK
jgi:hypothetical protein